MNYKSYGTRQSTPSRKTRKSMRSQVFLANKRMGKLARKAAKAKEASLEE